MGLPNVAEFPTLDLIDSLEDRTVGMPGWPHVTHWLCRLDGCAGLFVKSSNIRSAFDTMCESLGWPKDGENGQKLIRRSVAQLLRDPARNVPTEQLELQLGHRRIDSVTDLYAAFDPGYLADCTRAIEGLIDEIDKLAPGAFHRKDTGGGATIILMRA